MNNLKNWVPLVFCLIYVIINIPFLLTYSDDFLKKLIDVNPEVFGTCTIKKGNKPGITLVAEES